MGRNLISNIFKHWLEPWSSGYGRRLMYWRSWVRISALYSGWTKKQREAMDGPFKKYLLRLFNSVQMSATRWPVFHLSVNFLFPVSFGGFNWLTSALAIHGFSTVLQRNWDLPRLKLGPKTYFEFEHFFSKSSNLFFIFDLFCESPIPKI